MRRRSRSGLRLLSALLMVLLSLARPGAAKGGKKRRSRASPSGTGAEVTPEAHSLAIESDKQKGQIRCAACEHLVEHLDSLATAAVTSNRMVGSTARRSGKKKRKKKEMPWLESELGWGLALEEACERAQLADLAYLSRGAYGTNTEFKLMRLSAMEPELAAVAAEQQLANDPQGYGIFQRACQAVLDEHEDVLVREIKEGERNLMSVTGYKYSKEVRPPPPSPAPLRL